ncbi:MAG: radical SAM family heme chaperone HemW [Candidatus Dormibacteria bacterium]
MTAEAEPGRPRSLYVHVPFCSRRCPYCDFAIHVGGAEIQDRYTRAVVKELGQVCSPPLKLDTIYLGGGTPSRLRPELLGAVMEAVFAQFEVAADAEVTIEANPEDLTAELARAWLDLGINRLSLGVQSLDATTLVWLGRGHDADRAESALDAAREAGFHNISCDLIYAIPGQAVAILEMGLRRLLKHRPTHVSCYELTVEQGTPLARQIHSGTRLGPLVEDFLEQRRVVGRVLAEAGLDMYEVSNYALPGHRSRHNLAYWSGAPYLAVGPGAHGFLGPEDSLRLGLEPQGVALRYWHLRDTATYIRSMEAGQRGLGGHEWLGSAELELERLACGLRLSQGVWLGSQSQLARAAELAELGLLRVDGGLVRATERGFEVLDRVTLELSSV